MFTDSKLYTSLYKKKRVRTRRGNEAMRVWWLSSTHLSQPGFCGGQVTLKIWYRVFLRSFISPERVRQACPSEELVGPGGGEKPSETPHCRSPAGGSPGRPSHWASGVRTQEDSWCLESWGQFYSKGAHWDGVPLGV